MKFPRAIRHVALAIGLALVPMLASRGADEEGFKPIFNGKDLTGWKFLEKRGDGYAVENGLLVCPAGGGGNLFTEKEYANFILRFESRKSFGAGAADLLAERVHTPASVHEQDDRERKSVLSEVRNLLLHSVFK